MGGVASLGPSRGMLSAQTGGLLGRRWEGGKQWKTPGPQLAAAAPAANVPIPPVRRGDTVRCDMRSRGKGAREGEERGGGTLGVGAQLTLSRAEQR